MSDQQPQKTKKRAGLSKKLRFEVLKRDGFACQYCGAKAPDVLLHVDHIHPVAAGGKNAVMNLVTSCQPCNSGKSDRLLSDDAVVTVARKRAEETHERREQIKMLSEWHMSLVDADLEQAEAARAVIERMVPGRTLSESCLADVRKHVKAYGLDAVLSQFRRSFDERARPDLAVDHALRALKWKAHNDRDPVGSNARYLRGMAANCLDDVDEGFRRDDSILEAFTEALGGATFEEIKAAVRAAESWGDLSVTLHFMSLRSEAEMADSIEFLTQIYATHFGLSLDGAAADDIGVVHRNFKKWLAVDHFFEIRNAVRASATQDDCWDKARARIHGSCAQTQAAVAS